jgi:hypothetical protein
MSSAKFASLHSGLLARKGLATPAMLPLPVAPPLVNPRYTDAPAPGSAEPPTRPEPPAAVRPEAPPAARAETAAARAEAPAARAERPAVWTESTRLDPTPMPVQEEACCGGASVDRARGLDDGPPDHRTHVSVRLNAEQLRRLKTAAAQLHVSQQKIMADGLEAYLDKLAVEALSSCRCLRTKG